MSVLLAALSALLYGGADFAGGFACRRNPVLAVVFVSQLAGLAAAAAAAPLVGPNSPAAIDLFWGGAGGLLGALGLGFLYFGIGRGIVAVVSPLSALVGALVPMLFGLVSGETPSALAWGGALFCLPATFLLSRDASGPAGRAEVRTSFLIGLLAGAGFGGFFIALSRPGGESGLWPLVAARCLSLFSVGTAAFFRRLPLRLSAGSGIIVLAAGLFDMGANIAFVLAARGEMLILVTVVTSLFPAPTVLLARCVMHQRIGAARTAGLLLAVAGVALIGVG